MLKEFRRFVLRGNVVDLAVGVVIGAAFKSVVDSFVNGFLNPLVAFFSTGSLEKKTFCIGTHIVRGAKVCSHPFGWGQLVSSMISFLLIALVVFFLVVKPLNHLTERFDLLAPEETTRPCPECLSKIPTTARRCAFCTSIVQSP